MSRSSAPITFTFTAAAIFSLLLTAPLFAQSQGTCKFTSYNPPSGYIYDLSPGGINHWNTIVGGVGGPTQGMEKGYIRWSNGTFTLFSVPNATSTVFTDRNLNGTTVGWYGSQTASPPPQPPGSGTNGLIYTSSSWATLNYPGSPSTDLTGINKWNTIIGNAVDPKTKATFGFKYQHGGFAKIQYPGAAQTVLTAINDNGAIVGYWLDSSNKATGFLLQNGTFKTLNYEFPPVGINNSGVIVDSNHIHYPDGRTIFVYAGGANSAITGINDANVITGFVYFGTFEFQGFTGTCQ